MGLRQMLLGGSPGQHAITETVADAVRVVPGVSGHSVTYQHRRSAAGVVAGVVQVADSPTFLEVLRTVRAVLGPLLKDDADRVTFELTGRTPDGDSVRPAELGLSASPSGREIAERLRL